VLSHQLNVSVFVFSNQESVWEVADCEVDSVIRRAVTEQHASCSSDSLLGPEMVPRASNRSTCKPRRRFLQQTKLLPQSGRLPVHSVSRNSYISFPRPRNACSLGHRVQISVFALPIAFCGPSLKSYNARVVERVDATCSCC
jgi:hypothetical protein